VLFILTRLRQFKARGAASAVGFHVKLALAAIFGGNSSMAEDTGTEKPSTIMLGTVEKIIKPAFPSVPEKAQIAVEGADHLYREIRIENELTDADGEKVRLKEGAEVEVKVSAEPEDVAPAASTKS
jgi:hypothetical protein